jgi:F-type H+-transporting ATPase subunit epsilon
MPSLHLEIATPERQLVQTDVLDAQIPCLDGYIGVLPGHAALVSELKPGVLTYTTTDDSFKVLAIYGGFVEVLEDSIRVLADAAERKEEINLQKAQDALSKATGELEKGGVDIDLADALFEVQRAAARLEAAQREG